MKLKLLNLGCGSHHHPAWTNVDFVSSGDDVMPYDLNAGIPFEDGSFDAIYHSHLLEHLPRAYVPVFLKECNRVLKRGGTIRVAVPDLEQIVRIYLNELERSLDGDTESMQRYEWIILELLDQMVRNKPGGDMIRYWEQCPMPGELFVKQRMGAQLSNALHNISKRKNGNRNGANPLDNPPAKQIGEFRLSGEIHQWMYDRYSLGKLLREAGFRDIGTCRADESGIPAFNSYLLDIGPDGSVRKPDSLFMEATKTRFAPEKEKKNQSDNRLDQLLHERVEASDLTAGTIANANMLNVLHLSTMDHAGAGNAAYRLHNGLRSVGIRSTMLVLSKKTADRDVRVMPYAYPDLSLETNALSGYHERPGDAELFSITDARVRLDVREEIRNADIINLHWVARLLDYSHAATVLRGKKIIWTLHDMNPFTGGCHYSGGCVKYTDTCGACPQLGSGDIADLSRQGWEKKMNAYKYLDITVVTPSRWLGDCARKSSLLSKFPVHVIPYGFPLDDFRPYDKAGARKSLGISPTARVVLFGAQRIETGRKGIAYLLSALNRLSACNNDDDIVLACFGHVYEETRIRSKYPVIKFGHVNDSQRLAMIYSAADVFVIPSIEDNLPNTVAEAMACGLPVVGFEVGGIPDMVEHRRTGYLVRPRDVNGLIEGIDWVISQGNSFGLAQACREKAEQRYSLKVQAEAYRELYLKRRCMMNTALSNAIETNLQGEEMFAEGDIDGALAAFQRAIALDSSLTEAYNNIGVVFWQKEEIEKALQYFSTALQVDPDNRDTVINCGKILACLNSADDARNLYQQYLIEHPEDKEISRLMDAVIEGRR